MYPGTVLVTQTQRGGKSVHIVTDRDQKVRSYNGTTPKIVGYCHDADEVRAMYPNAQKYEAHGDLVWFDSGRPVRSKSS